MSRCENGKSTEVENFLVFRRRTKMNKFFENVFLAAAASSSSSLHIARFATKHQDSPKKKKKIIHKIICDFVLFIWIFWCVDSFRALNPKCTIFSFCRRGKKNKKTHHFVKREQKLLRPSNFRWLMVKNKTIQNENSNSNSNSSRMGNRRN